MMLNMTRDENIMYARRKMGSRRSRRLKARSSIPLIDAMVPALSLGGRTMGGLVVGRSVVGGRRAAGGRARAQAQAADGGDGGSGLGARDWGQRAGASGGGSGRARRDLPNKSRGGRGRETFEDRGVKKRREEKAGGADQVVRSNLQREAGTYAWFPPAFCACLSRACFPQEIRI